MEERKISKRARFNIIWSLIWMPINFICIFAFWPIGIINIFALVYMIWWCWDKYENNEDFYYAVQDYLNKIKNTYIKLKEYFNGEEV